MPVRPLSIRTGWRFPSEQGWEAARAITRAIEVAGLSPQDVQHVNAHATSTGIGDLSEACAIDSALGDHAAVYAPKSALGHSVGAAGAIVMNFCRVRFLLR